MIRYPGVSPFEAEQENIFFGRDKDIEKFKKLIILRKQVLLYSKSGIGKTSLLNAGVLPLLEDKYILIKIRFHAYNKERPTNPILRIFDAINEAIPNFKEFSNTILDEIVENKNFEPTLWSKFKEIQLANTKKQFILVFDQFEEIFSYPEECIKQFKNDFYELTKIDVPDKIMQLISEKPGIENHKQIDNLYEEINIKSVFAIRSDRLSLLNKLSDKMPNIQKVFYELKALDKNQIKEAIIKPAIEDKNEYETNKFSFTENTINKIITALTSSSKGKHDIETAQLQIVCTKLEEIAQEKYNKTSNRSNIIIEEKDLPEFKEIFYKFYQDSVKKTNEKENARQFIEDQLIRSKQRISLDKVVCENYVTHDTLKKLVETRLIKIEKNNLGSFSYELSHDTLIEPILESRSKRIREIEKKKAEQKDKELEQKNKEQVDKIRLQRKNINKQRKLLFAIALIALISIILAITNNKQKKELKFQNNEIQTLNKENDDKNIHILNLNKKYYRRKAENHIKHNEYDNAIKKYLYLTDTLMFNDTIYYEKDTLIVSSEINKCKVYLIQKTSFDSSLLIAQQYFKENKIKSAIKQYNNTINRYDNLLNNDFRISKAEIEKMIFELEKRQLNYKIIMNEAKTNEFNYEETDLDASRQEGNKAIKYQRLSNNIDIIINKLKKWKKIKEEQEK